MPRNSIKIQYMTGRRKETGATLLIIIIAMIVVAVLGIAIYALFSTATLNQVVAQRAAKAFYLSESGIRIAAGEYRAAAAANNVNPTLCTLNNKTFTMPDNVSTIQIKVYPYWFYATAADATNSNSSSTTLYLHLPGAVPCIDDSDTPVTFPSMGLLRIKDSGRTTPWVGSIASTTFVNYTNVNVGTLDATLGTPVTFTLSADFPAPNQIIAGDELYIGNNSYTAALTAPNQGGNLVLNLDSADNNDNTAKIFPPQRGTIFVVTSSALSQYSYDTRIITATSSPHTVTLTNMQPIAGAPAPQWPLTVSFGTQIYIGKSLGFRSTSTYGQ
jgi:hypothetical protein